MARSRGLRKRNRSRSSLLNRFATKTEPPLKGLRTPNATLLTGFVILSLEEGLIAKIHDKNAVTCCCLVILEKISKTCQKFAFSVRV